MFDTTEEFDFPYTCADIPIATIQGCAHIIHDAEYGVGFYIDAIQIYDPDDFGKPIMTIEDDPRYTDEQRSLFRAITQAMYADEDVYNDFHEKLDTFKKEYTD